VPADAAAALVADEVGTAVTVTTLVMTVGTQVLIKIVDKRGAEEEEAGATTTGRELVALTTTAVVLELA